MTTTDKSRADAPGAKVIMSTNGYEILVDEEDFERCSRVWWHVIKKGYAVRGIFENGQKFEVKMHRFILGLDRYDGRIVDHANGNRLDNRKCNLRLCTKAQNGWNQGPQKTNTTGYKGVSRTPNGRYTSQIRHLGRKHHLGIYPTAEEAHEVYCLAADLLHGEFANHGNLETAHV